MVSSGAGAVLGDWTSIPGKLVKTHHRTFSANFDSDALILPGNHTNRKALVEAARNADSLGKWIAKVSAEQVVVVPAVALLGWSLSIKRYGEVAVYSATNMSDHLPKRGRLDLSPAEIQRIAAQVEHQCTVGAAPIDPH